MAELKKLTYTHDAMVDLILQEPTVKAAELAVLFGYSEGWIQRVMSSDAFVARLAERKAVLTDPALAQTLNERVRTVAIQSMDIISEKLTSEQSAQYALEALGIASRALSGARA